MTVTSRRRLSVSLVLTLILHFVFLVLITNSTFFLISKQRIITAKIIKKSIKMDDSNKDDIHIRPAKREDMLAVAEMIQELADFEKMTHGPKMSVKDLEHDGFERDPPSFQCNIAVDNSGLVNPVVGYALYFPTYSTWEGRSMMLEDLYVRPNQRRKGIGKKLFKSVAKKAKETGCNRLDFHVLEWNPARSFYENEGAVNLTTSEQWYYYRLAGDALQKYTSDGD